MAYDDVFIMFLFALFVLALLIGNTAAGLASRLAGSLALTAAALLGALAQIAGLDGLDVFHGTNLHKILLKNVTTFPPQSQHSRRLSRKIFENVTSEQGIFRS